MSPPRIVVVGDVMVDVVAVTSAPLAVGSDTPARVSDRGGGSAANVAAWLGLRGVRTAYVGRVGDDPPGRAAVDELRRLGVEVHARVDAERPTGTCIVLVSPDGERSMLPDPGANAALSPADLPPDLLAGAAHLHLSGYVLLREASRAAGRAVLRQALERGVSVSVDPASAAPLRATGPDGFRRWTEGVELLLANADEAEVLAGADDPERAGARLAGWYPEVVVKLGAAGARWHGAGGAAVAVPAEPAVVVDSTGAGDAFAAGYLAARVAGALPPECLRAGAHLAARAVAQVGARPVGR